MKRYAAYLLVCACLFFCACANQGAVGTATPDAQQSPVASMPEPALTEPVPTLESVQTAEPTLSPSAVAGDVYKRQLKAARSPLLRLTLLN